MTDLVVGIVFMAGVLLFIGIIWEAFELDYERAMKVI